MFKLLLLMLFGAFGVAEDRARWGECLAMGNVGVEFNWHVRN